MLGARTAVRHGKVCGEYIAERAAYRRLRACGDPPNRELDETAARRRLRIDLERRTDHQEHVDEHGTSARPYAIQGDGNGPHAVIDYLHQSREAR